MRRLFGSQAGALALALGLILGSSTAHAGSIIVTSEKTNIAVGETNQFDLWIEIGASELIRGVQATFEFSNMDPAAAPVFTQVPDLLAGAVMAPWGLSSTIAQGIGDPANVVTVIQANATDQSLAALAGVVELGLVLLNDNALPLGSVTLTGGSAGAVEVSFVSGRDQLCSNVAGDCVIENLASTLSTGLTVGAGEPTGQPIGEPQGEPQGEPNGVPEPSALVLLGLALGGLALRRR